MKATLIDYKDTRSFSKLLINYLANEESLRAFYGNRPDIDGFKKQLEEKHFPYREELKQVLIEQYRDYKSNEKSIHNIESLADSNTFTVTTGHQLNLFTGPLYFIFKIVSTIVLAKRLKENFPDKNFVPVFWMATEDHDFAEINHTSLFGKTIQWDVPATGATGRIKTAGIEETVKEYQSILGLSENSSKLSDLIESAYIHKGTLSEATRHLVNELFADYGLVIIDADTPALKKLFAPIMMEDILKEVSYHTISKTTDALEKAGYKAQVHIREINFFYLGNDFRERIVKNAMGQYEVLNQNLSFTEDELIKEIENHPERFSPNAVLRPLYQEVVLPNLAYIGGAAEVAYWMQLKEMFAHYQVLFPILIPRNSAMLTDDSVAEKIFRLNFTFKSIFKDSEVLKKEYVRLHTTNRLNLDDEWREMKGIFEKIKLRAHKIDPSLGPSTDAVKARLKRTFDSLEKKLLKAEQRNFSESQVQIERIKNKLFPDGILQERVENFAFYYLKYGDSFIDELVKNLEPLDFKFTVLY
jgi:bacillithiol biosynthesis cysteine-adding enzyme BshC